MRPYECAIILVFKFNLSSRVTFVISTIFLLQHPGAYCFQSPTTGTK